MKAKKTTKKSQSKKSTKTKKTYKDKTNKSSDKSMGKDNKGLMIYKCPQGGKYYINSNGNKTYVKK